MPSGNGHAKPDCVFSLERQDIDLLEKGAKHDIGYGRLARHGR